MVIEPVRRVGRDDHGIADPGDGHLVTHPHLTAPGRHEEDLLDRVRTPAAAHCDLLVVPRLHAFATASGTSDHIGSLPVMRIRTPALSGAAWALNLQLHAEPLAEHALHQTFPRPELPIKDRIA